VTVWNFIGKLSSGRARFALQWMWQNEEVFRVVTTQLIGMPQFSKSLLFNGYRDCKDLERKRFSDDMWRTIDGVFQNELLVTHLPKPIRREIYAIGRNRGSDLSRYLEKQISKIKKELRLSLEDVMVKPVSATTRKQLPGYFFGDWEKEGMDLVAAEDVPLCRRYPKEFIILETCKNITNVYDNSGKSPCLIAMVLQHNLLSCVEKSYIRVLMSQLFVVHNVIERERCGVLNGSMVGFGPFFHSRILGGGKKLSFYKSVKQVKDLFSKIGLTEQFGAMVDRHAHGQLVDIILGMFLCWCPSLVKSFFNFSAPHLAHGEYEPTTLELELKGKGPCAYQMYVIEDYYSV